MKDSIKRFLKPAYLAFAFFSILYILWVLWMENLWLLPGVIIIFDFFISKKVKWLFWRKEGLIKSKILIELIDATVFGIVAATFIRLFFMEAYSIPTSSMERSCL
jgi:signal peptidase I